MFLVGLTGGIGSGKSLVAELFRTHGAEIVDTDRIAHQLTAPQGAAIDAIVQRFGKHVLTAEGALDRDRMRAQIFGDAGARKQLEQILHPLIDVQARQEIARSSASYAVVVVPLLIEHGGWKERVDRIAVVDCPEDAQIARVVARNGWPQAQVQAVLAAQVSREVRLAAADDIIDNSGALADLEPQVEHLHLRYLAYAANLRTIGR
ncbi:MAG: dephospho-CoA kinase [Burkholderiaceae bacterium]|nr:MAG: dephospho-CoA kinase [Burkholderiaceae bacterium]